jgi:hypothetical protein
MIKRYYSMFNCNQNNNSYKKGIKYYLWPQRLDIQTNIAISTCFGFQNFSEKQNKL